MPLIFVSAASAVVDCVTLIQTCPCVTWLIRLANCTWRILLIRLSGHENVILFAMEFLKTFWRSFEML